MQETIKKLKFRGEAVVLHAPDVLRKEFVKLGFKTHLTAATKSANTLIFVNNAEEYSAFLRSDLPSMEDDGVLWFAYPKGTSKIKTNINRDSMRAMGEEFGITAVAAISIDDTWSALRFRPIGRVGK